MNPELITEVEQLAEEYDVPYARIGLAHGNAFSVKNLLTIPVEDLQETWSNRLVDALDSGTTQG